MIRYIQNKARLTKEAKRIRKVKTDLQRFRATTESIEKIDLPRYRSVDNSG